MNRLLAVSAVVGAAAAAVVTTMVPAAARQEAKVDLSPGITASYLMFDRQSSRELVAHDEHKRFRSASVVKLLIALDYLESHGPGYSIPDEDLALLQPMLRASNDDAASRLWVRDGWEQIVTRMAAKIGLADTAPPANRGVWGYTAISAADVVKIYRYILDTADPSYRDFIMGNLHQSARYADDGFDQSFGIPSAIPGPSGVKQGWSGFGAQPKSVDTDAGLDVTGLAMHTTGTVGDGDRQILVVLTLEPAGTSWQDSAARITAITKQVYAASHRSS